jgi:type I restriction enzyme S subunit
MKTYYNEFFEKEQQKIGLFFGEIDNLIYKISKKKENIQKLFNHILNRSFSKSKNLKKLEELLIYKSEKNKNSYNEVYSVSNKRGFIKQTDYFSEHTVASSDLKNYKVVKKYDFAYNPARINVGSIAVYEQNEPGVVSPMYVVFGTNNINYKYLNYFFKSKYFKVQLSQYLVGSVRKILDFKSMSKIIINFDKDNQKKVEDILDKLEKLIELETQRFEYLSIFKEHYLRLIFN